MLTHVRFWRVMYWTLLALWLLAAGLGMQGVHGGFFTSYLADLTQPAWLYVYCRGLAPPSSSRWWLVKTVGRTPARAALLLFVASAATEFSQRTWPHGLMAGRWDPFDLLAYAVGIGACYAVERWWIPSATPATFPSENAA